MLRRLILATVVAVSGSAQAGDCSDAVIANADMEIRPIGEDIHITCTESMEHLAQIHFFIETHNSPEPGISVIPRMVGNGHVLTDETEICSDPTGVVTLNVGATCKATEDSEVLIALFSGAVTSHPLRIYFHRHPGN